MAILKTDTRFTIETLLAIARITSSPTTREALLEEALEILRTGETVDFRNSTNEFLSHWKPSKQNKIPQKTLFDLYIDFAISEGLPVIGKNSFYKAMRERGFRVANYSGTIMVYAEEVVNA